MTALAWHCYQLFGVGKSIALGYPFWVAIIMGSITGAAGGVIRDVFINEIPLIFRKEIYAMACVVGGTFYWLCDLMGHGVLCMSGSWRCYGFRYPYISGEI